MFALSDDVELGEAGKLTFPFLYFQHRRTECKHTIQEHSLVLFESEVVTSNCLMNLSDFEGLERGLERSAAGYLSKICTSKYQ